MHANTTWASKKKRSTHARTCPIESVHTPTKSVRVLSNAGTKAGTYRTEYQPTVSESGYNFSYRASPKENVWTASTSHFATFWKIHSSDHDQTQAHQTHRRRPTPAYDSVKGDPGLEPSSFRRNCCVAASPAEVGVASIAPTPSEFYSTGSTLSHSRDCVEALRSSTGSRRFWRSSPRRRAAADSSLPSSQVERRS